VIHQITLSDYLTVNDLATAIRALGNGWSVSVVDGTANPAYSEPIDETDAGLFSNRATLFVYDLDWLELLVSRAKSFFESYCWRKLDVQEHTESRLFFDGQKLVLKYYPVTELDSITIGTSSTGASVMSESDYEIDLNNGVIEFYGELAATKITVTYTSGYETLPVDIKNVILDVASHFYMSAGRDPRVMTERMGTYYYSLAKESMGPELFEKLELYRRYL